jgi:hypothetical protein
MSDYDDFVVGNPNDDQSTIDPLLAEVAATVEQHRPGVDLGLGLTGIPAKLYAAKLRGIRKQTREQAIDYGRRLGEDEAERRHETGAIRDERIARAKHYAAWEWDGKPRRAFKDSEFYNPVFKKSKTKCTADTTRGMRCKVCGEIHK